jgi:hypothetical protein
MMVPLLATVWVTSPTPLITPVLVFVIAPLPVPLASSVPPAKLSRP